MKKIGILGRSGGDPERGKVLINMGRMLKENFHLDLIVNSKEINPCAKDFYNIKNYVKFDIKYSTYIKLFLNDLINLYKYCKKEKPDRIFQYTCPYIQGPVVALIGRLTKTFCITRFSGATFEFYKSKKRIKDKILAYLTLKWYMRLMFLANKVIVLGESQKSEAIKNGCKSEKILILPQPIDELNFYPAKSKSEAKKKLGIPTNKTVILWVGNLQDYKGIDSLKNLIICADKSKKDFLFLIVGKDFNNTSEKLRKASKIVRIEGVIPNTEMVKYYQAADLLIHTSYIEASVPNTIWEALACGTPAIGRDIRDIKKVADAVFRTDEELIDIVLCKNWKSSTHSKVPEEYAWNNLKNKYISVFNRGDL